MDKHFSSRKALVDSVLNLLSRDDTPDEEGLLIHNLCLIGDSFFIKRFKITVRKKGCEEEVHLYVSRTRNDFILLLSYYTYDITLSNYYYDEVLGGLPKSYMKTLFTLCENSFESRENQRVLTELQDITNSINRILG